MNTFINFFRSAVIGFAALALPATGAFASTFEDAALRERIESRFQADARVQSFEFQIETNNGHVTLKGTPPDLEQFAHAVSIALATTGTQSVRSEVTVAAPTIDDGLLREQAQAVLDTIPGRGAQEGRVRIENQTATIEGRFPSYAALDGIIARISGIEGIRAVRVMATLAAPVRVDDNFLLTSVAKQLVYDAEVNATNIRVGVQDGHIWLEGVADDARQANRAESLARFTSGVVGVTNLLQTSDRLLFRD